MVRLGLLLCALLLGVAGEASAQSWPARPVKLIVPTGPGAATDVIARLMADNVTRKLGQPVVVENNPGGVRELSAELRVNAVPDL